MSGFDAVARTCNDTTGREDSMGETVQEGLREWGRSLRVWRVIASKEDLRERDGLCACGASSQVGRLFAGADGLRESDGLHE